MGYEIDFLAVGDKKSGDAITLRFGNLHGRRDEQVVIVVDGGYADTGRAVVDHLRANYGTTQVDLVVSTHPDGDHAAGLETVLTECQVGCLWMHQPWNHTEDIAKMFQHGRVTDTSVSEALRKSLDDARALERIAVSRKIPIIEPFTGTRDASGRVYVIGPTQEFYESLLPDFRCTPVPAQAGILTKFAERMGDAVKNLAEDWTSKPWTTPGRRALKITLEQFS